MNEIYRHLAPWLLTLCEAVLTLAAFGLSLVHRRTQSRPHFEQANRAFRPLAHRRGLSLLFVTGLTMGLRALLIPVLGIPLPNWNDEFSYLLAANTFAFGPCDQPHASDVDP